MTRSVLVATANFVVRRTLASSLTRNRSPGPGFSFGREAHRHDVDLGPGRRDQVVEPLAEQRARTVQPRGVDQDQLGVGAVHDAAYDGPGGLRLRGGDRHLGADDRVGQRGLAGVGPAHEAGEAGPVLAVSGVLLMRAPRACVVVGPDLARRTSRRPARGVDRARDRPARACAAAAAAPVAHHVVVPGVPAEVVAQRAGGSSRIWADSPRHPEVPRPLGPRRARARSRPARSSRSSASCQLDRSPAT